MVFGIDLGTTNSVIGSRGELCSDLVSSNVNIMLKTQVSRDLYGEDIESSYKVDMSMSDTGKLPILCSSIILKDLATKAERRIGEEVKDVVISVPAYFVTSQREAVYEAARQAGLNVKQLINEPTAAAIYVSRDIKDLLVVYDLGGGTFDVTIIDSRSGLYSTVATDGKNIGGDDLDSALLEWVLKEGDVKVRFRTPDRISRLRSEVRLAKETLQQTKSDVYMNTSYIGGKSDLLLTVNKYKEIIYKVFGSTIEKTMQLIDTYIGSYEKPKMIYTGGSTYCPFLMELIRESIPYEELNYSCKKDMLVARGVSYVAWLVEQGKAEDLICDVTKRLCIENSDGFSTTIIEHNSIVPCSGKAIVTNSKDSNKLTLRLYQGNSSVAKNNTYIGTLEYLYDSIMPAQEGDVIVQVSVSYNGIVTLEANEVLDSIPQTINLQLR